MSIIGMWTSIQNSTPAIQPPILIYIGGQSNAVGQSAGPPASPYDTPIVGAKIWTGSAFSTIEYGVNNQGNSLSQFGVELSLAKKLVELFGNDKVYLVKYAINSTAIGQVPTEQDWNVSSSELLPLAVSKINAAKNQIIVDTGVSPLMFGVWLQGERDSRFTLYPPLYQSNFESIMLNILNNTGLNNWVLNRLGTPQRLEFADPENTWDITRGQQEFIVADNANVKQLNLDDVVFFDGLHYNASSNIAKGIEIANVINSFIVS